MPNGYQPHRLECLGRLAGGVAHDINNLLTVITASLTAARDCPTCCPEHRHELLVALGAADRIAELTHRLLAFSSRQPLPPTVVDLVALSRDLLFLLQRLVGRHVELRFTPRLEKAPTLGDPVLMEQVITNLVVNARDAMPGGGVVSIAIDQGPPIESADGPGNPRASIALSVRDSGTGMAPEILSRIFDPLFTTKAASGGTGLGLPTVLDIVRQHGGDVLVESLPEAGSTFTVLLPRVPDEDAAEPNQAASPPRRATILLVDDDERVRSVAGRALRSDGHEVIEAAGSIDALAILGDATRHIDVLLTDLIMPEGDGHALAEAARRLRPTLRVLVSSGQGDRGSPARCETGGYAIPVLVKPYTRSALLCAVRTALLPAAPDHVPRVP